MADLTSTTLGSCQIVQLISKGGMGAIYLAKQLLLNRTVAVKVIRSDRDLNSEFIERFKHEAQALAALEHPHIVPLYEYGVQNEIAYFVMPYISGGTLQEWLKHGPLAPSEAVRLLEQLATALDFAHKRSIIHRDIKPANVLLRDDKWPLLADFGVAKLMADTTQSAGIPVGTPRYMAPEQWLGQRISSQTDIYALGILFYELLVGTPPFQGNDWGSIMRQHLQDPPASICDRNPHIPRSLEQIVNQALAKESSQRFTSAGQFAMMSKQALEVKNVTATQPMPGIFPSPIFQNFIPNQFIDPFAVPPAQTRPLPISKEEQTAATTAPLTSSTQISETEPGMSAISTLKINHQAAPHQLLETPLIIAEWKNLPAAVDTIALLPDTRQVISSSLNSVFVWEIGTPYPTAQMAGHTRTIWGLAVTSDGQLLASGSWDRSIRLWDIAQRRLLRTIIGHSDIILALTLAMKDHVLVSASRDGTLRYWELPSGRQLRSIRHPGGPVWSVITLPSDDLIAAGAENGIVGLWSLKNGQQVWNTSIGNVGQVRKLLILQPQQLLCITQNGSVALINLSTGDVQQPPTPPATLPDNAVALFTKAICADTNGALHYWDLENREQRLAVRAHDRRIPAMAVQTVSGIVVTGSEDRSIKLWRFIQTDQV